MARLCRLILLSAMAVTSLAFGVVFAHYTVLLVVLVGFTIAKRLRTWTGSGWSHGTARLATLDDLYKANLLGKSGVILGRATLCDPPSLTTAVRSLLNPGVNPTEACRLAFAAFLRRPVNSIIRAPDAVHTLVLAPTGAGKGVSHQIPTLLSDPSPMVVVDPQGTLYRETAAHRRDVFGHQIVCIDPFGFARPAEDADCFNPCDFIPADDSLVDTARMIANTMVKREKNEFQPYFNDWAIQILTTALVFICGYESEAEHRTLTSLRDLVASKVTFTEAVKKMRSMRGLIAKLGDVLDWPAAKELSSIISTVHSHTAWMDSPAAVASMSKTTFDLAALRKYGRMTIYLVLPSSKLSTHAALMRLWLSTILNVLTRDKPSETNKIVFMIDEAAHIGKIQLLEDSVTLMRAYGIRLMFYFQSISQLQVCYGDSANTILENMTTQLFYGTNAWESAENLSKRMGEFTTLVESINKSYNQSRSSSHGHESGSISEGSNAGININETGRRLLRPEEILTLPRSVFIAFYQNNVPIVGELVRYHDAPEFRNGKCGQSAGIGVVAVLMAVLLLGVSLAMAGAVDSLIAAKRSRGPVAVPAYRYRQPLPYGVYGGGQQRIYPSRQRRPLPSRSSGVRQWPSYRRVSSAPPSGRMKFAMWA